MRSGWNKSLLACGMVLLATAWPLAGLVQAGPANTTPLELPSASEGRIPLAPAQVVQLIVARNAEVLYARLGSDVASAMKRAEEALYEPILFGGYRGEKRERQRSTEERLLASPVSVLDEDLQSLEAGVRSRAPSGAEVSLSFKQIDRRSNIISTYSTGGNPYEYTGSLMLTVKQPLLRGFGREVTETDRQVAALEHRISVLQFRQQALKASSEGLALYWQLQRAQEGLQLRRDGVENARRLLQDMGARVQAGRVPASQVTEIRANLLLREADLVRSEQALREAHTRLLTTLNVSMTRQPVSLRVVDAGTGEASAADAHVDELEQVLERWPAHQISRLRREQGQVRLNFAEHQRKPLLDLVLSYSGSGLAREREEAGHLALRTRYPELIVGVNLEMPIGGNGKAESQYAAQLGRIEQSELELASIRTSLANDLHLRQEEVRSALQVQQQSRQDLSLRQALLEVEQSRFALGVGLLATLLQRETEWLESRQRLLESRMRLEIARVNLQYVRGTLLADHGIVLKD